MTLPSPRRAATAFVERLALDRRDALVCLLLLALALTLNLTAITWGLPSAERSAHYPADVAWYDIPKGPERLYKTAPFEPYHPDEGILLDAMSNMDPGRLDFNPRFFNYPSLSIYLTGALLQAGQMAGYVSAVNSKAYYVANPEQIARIYLLGRLLAATMSALTVAGLYLTVRLVGDAVQPLDSRALALFSGLTLALLPLWVRNSHFMLVNVPSVLWMVGSALAAVTALRRRSLRALALSAFIAGLAASTKYPSGMVLVLPLYAAWHLPGRRARRWAWLLALFAGAFVLGTPYALATPGLFIQDVFFEGDSKLGLPPVRLLATHGVFALGSVALLLALAGLGLTLRRRREWPVHLLWLWLAVGLGQRLISDADFARYLIPALPPLAIGAGVALETVRRRAGARRAWLGWALATALLLPAAGYSADILHLLSRPDIRTVAADWIAANVPAGTPVGIYEDIFYDLPPVNAEVYPVVPFRDLAPDAYPPVLVWTSAHAIIRDRLPDPATTTMTWTQRPAALWTWPATTPPHDWGYTFLDVYVRVAP